MDIEKRTALVEQFLETLSKAEDLSSAQAMAPAAASLLSQIVQMQSAAPYEILDFMQMELSEMLGF